MSERGKGRWRRLWFNVHLWIGVGLLVLLIPLGLTGAALVWSDELMASGGPAVSGGAPLAPSRYLEAASAALNGQGRPVALRWPKSAGDPVVVQARPGGRGASGPGPARGRPRQIAVTLNPADARVLSVGPGRPAWWMTLHGFHENLMNPPWGRAVVGWLGVAMLVSSLTGIWLWWPRAGFLKGLRFRRQPGFWMSLHYTAGFWISLPLAFVSLTGVGLGFPQQARALIGMVAPLSPQPGRPGGDEGGGRPERAGGARTDAEGATREGGERRNGEERPHRGGEHARGQVEGGRSDPRGEGRGGGGFHPALSADQAIAAAKAAPGSPRVLTLPTRDRPVWKLELADGRALEVDDASGQARAAAPPPSGDVAWRWIHRLHGGTDLPLVWRVIVTLTGVAPALLGLTGLCVWLSRLLRRRALMSDVQ